MQNGKNKYPKDNRQESLKDLKAKHQSKINKSKFSSTCNGNKEHQKKQILKATKQNKTEY